MSKGMLAVLLASLMVLVASGILVSAADAAVPGDWMYGVDRAMDGLRVRPALDPKQKAQVERQLAQERLHEAQMLTQRGEPSKIELLRQESRKALLAAKTADPHATRKAEKPAAKMLTTAQVEPNERQLEQTRPAKGDPYCSGKAARHQPAGEKLAQRLGVNYGEVMRWYCQGYKLSEIGLAYRISRTTGVGVDQVFARRLNGLGWGEIMKKYGLNGKEE